MEKVIIGTIFVLSVIFAVLVGGSAYDYYTEQSTPTPLPAITPLPIAPTSTPEVTPEPTPTPAPTTTPVPTSQPTPTPTSTPTPAPTPTPKPTPTPQPTPAPAQVVVVDYGYDYKIGLGVTVTYHGTVENQGGETAKDCQLKITALDKKTQKTLYSKTVELGNIRAGEKKEFSEEAKFGASYMKYAGHTEDVGGEIRVLWQ